MKTFILPTDFLNGKIPKNTDTKRKYYVHKSISDEYPYTFVSCILPLMNIF